MVATRLAGSSRFALAEKLKRALRRASDPWSSRPLIDTPAYANSTALLVGQVVKANGNLYVVVVGGTTASSGTGPSVSNGTATDGTVTFSYYSPAPANYTDADAPTVTLSTSAPGGSMINIFSPEATNATNYVQNCARPIGSYVTYDGSNRNLLITFNRAAADPVGRYTGWEFETDAPSVAIRFSTISVVRTIGIEIDGRILQLGGLALPTGGAAWVKLDFPAGARKVRRIKVWHGMSGDIRMRDIYVTNRDIVQAPTGERVRAAFISDSIFDGSAYGPMIAGASMPQRIAAALGWDDPWHFTQGGTGYNNPGPGPYYTYRQRVAEAASRSPDVWVPFGSTNDGGYTSAQRRSEALATLRDIRAVSAAPILMMGVWSVNSGTATIEADMKAAFDAFADDNSAFIPVSSPTTNLPWITGSYNNSAHSTASTGGYAIAADELHPLDSGTALGAARAANEMRAIIAGL